MLVEWNELKNFFNFRSHGVKFEEAANVFGVPSVTYFDEVHSGDEDRFNAIGLVGSKLIVVTFVERASDVVRIISARKATKREEQRYERGY